MVCIGMSWKPIQTKFGNLQLDLTFNFVSVINH